MTTATIAPIESLSGSRRGFGRGTAALLFAVVVLAGCSGGPGSSEEFVEVLTRDGNLSEQEATCISEAVFDQYEADEDALKRISDASNIDSLNSEDNGVPGFVEFYDETVRGCATTGPTPG